MRKIFVLILVWLEQIEVEDRVEGLLIVLLIQVSSLDFHLMLPLTLLFLVTAGYRIVVVILLMAFFSLNCFFIVLTKFLFLLMLIQIMFDGLFLSQDGFLLPLLHLTYMLLKLLSMISFLIITLFGGRSWLPKWVDRRGILQQ